MANQSPIRQDLADLPFGEFIRSMAIAIADAQFELDKTSIKMAEFMSGRQLLRHPVTGEPVDESGEPVLDGKGAPVGQMVVRDTRIAFGYTYEDGKRVPQHVSMMELGFVPTFYQFVDTVIEVRIALRVSRLNTSVDPPGGASGAAPGALSGAPGPGPIQISSTPVDATYASSFGYQLQMASVFKTRLAPVPPPTGLEERIRETIRQESIEAARARGPETPT